MTTLVGNLVALFGQRQAVDFHYVIEHTGEGANDLAVFLVVEAGLVGERVVHELGQVDRTRSEEHTSELQSRPHLVCRLLLEKKNKYAIASISSLLSAYFWL